jgi:hypothetical protein
MTLSIQLLKASDIPLITNDDLLLYFIKERW